MTIDEKPADDSSTPQTDAEMPETPKPLPPEAEAPVAPAADPVPNRRSGLIGGLIAVVVVLLAVIASSPFWAPELAAVLPWGARQQDKVADRLQAIEQKVAALEARAGAEPPAVGELKRSVATLQQRVAELEKRPQAAGDTAQLQAALQKQQAAIEKLSGELGQIRDRVAATQVNPATVEGVQADTRKTADAVAALADRVGKLETQQRQTASDDRTDQALLLAVAGLRDALRSSQPFADQLTAVEALAKKRPQIAGSLASLEAASKTGVATMPELRRRFATVAAAIVHAGEGDGGTDLGSKIVARLRSLVTIRRIDGQAQNPTEAAIAAAEKALDGGDLAGAVNALGALQGAPAEAAKPWLEAARKRLAVEQALAAVQGRLVASLAQQSADGQGAAR